MIATSLQAIATSVVQERSLDVVLQRIVGELAAQPNVALTRIWLIGSDDDQFEASTSGQAKVAHRVLKLAASAGTPVSNAQGKDWSRIDGAHRRVSLGQGKVGCIAQTGKPVLLEDTATDQQWIVDQRWTHDEQIVSFAGQPLLFRNEILGVLALFSRERLTQVDFDWLRAFADQAAVAIANARAFEEIERLRSQLERENRYLREEIREAHAFGEIIGTSAAMHKLLEQVALVAPTDASVLVQGESGTGKELVARAIHERSQRAEHSLVKVNCAAIPRELFESEFFGHVKGSFTGALKDRVGRFQLANQGTHFLDDLGEIPLELQGKLLRVLQEGQLERVGDDQTKRVDVRVIAATNRHLAAEVAAGRFRQDLYYRLSVFPIEVAPLRERREDVAALTEHFLRQACRQMNRPTLALSPQHLDQLQRYDWPGNVRELQNVIQRAVIGAQRNRWRLDDLLVPRERLKTMATSAAAGADESVLTKARLRELEAENLSAALERTNWKIYGPRGAAELLAMKPTTLASRLKRLGISKPR